MTNTTPECLYAHSLEGHPQSEWQSLAAHLSQVADLAARYAAPFAASEWARAAGLLHDLGKASSAFQGYLVRQNGLDDSQYDFGRVNHSSAGAAYAREKLGKSAGKILAYLVAGHHAGLPDDTTAATGLAALAVRLEDGKKNLDEAAVRSFAATLPLSAALRPPAYMTKNSGGCHLWMRLLYSCLVDADFLDTEAFMNPQPRGGFDTIATLKQRFDHSMADMTTAALDTPVNRIRARVLAACRAAAINHVPKAGGLFSLAVPTGGGKTLSAMAFALEHAVAHGQARIIYVIPYTSIIEQTAAVLTKIFGADNVVEHHSNLDPEKETPRSRLATENWDAPIIVTTNVQFFESLYAAKSSRCRKLHNIVNSVVILDEAQLLPPELLEPCVAALNQLSRHYGVTTVLSTATQPALPAIDTPREIIPPDLRLYEALNRVDYHFPDDMVTPVTWEGLAQELTQYDQVLCVVNSRRACYDLHRYMPEDTIHLSALMCGEHRSRVIDDIKARLEAKDKPPCRVISTQLVEAGVDIDFPVVYRALAGLDSIAQSAGRCNREGKLEAGNLHVFIPPTPPPPGILRKGESATRELVACGIDPRQPESFKKYFELFYCSVNNTGDEFEELLVRDANPQLSFAFRTAAEKFRFIDDRDQRSVIVRYGDSPKLIERLLFAGPTCELMRKLQRYVVTINVHTATKLQQDGKLELIHENLYVQTLDNLYGDKGLDIFSDTLPAEDLVI